MSRKSRSRIRRRFIAMLPMLSLAVSTVPAAGGESPEPRGARVEVDGSSFYLDCVGSGSPTTVIDAGAGSWSIYYRQVQNELALSTRVCTYDRAGLGLSSSRSGPRTSSTMADELYRLLQESGEEGPFLLAGHSLGGYNIRIFQQRYSADVAGLVLLDSAHPQQWDRLPGLWQAVETMLPALRALPDALVSGQVAVSDLPPWPESLADEMRPLYEDAMAQPGVHRATAEEWAMVRVSAGQVPEGDLGQLPVVVASAGRSFDTFADRGLPVERLNIAWAELQSELSALSGATEHRVSPTATHDLVVTDSSFVVAAVERGIELVRARRTERPKPPAVDRSN